MSQRRLFETPLSHSRSRNENDATNIVPLEHPTLILVSLDAFCFGLRDAFRAFFFDVFSQKHASFFKARCSNYFCQFFFSQNVTSSCHTKNKNAKRNEINDDDDDDDDDEIGSGIIRL